MLVTIHNYKSTAGTTRSLPRKSIALSLSEVSELGILSLYGAAQSSLSSANLIAQVNHLALYYLGLLLRYLVPLEPQEI